MSLDDLLTIPQTKDHLSASQMFDWFTCRQLYYYKHAERREPDYRRPLKVARGSAGHRAVEYYLTKKLEQKPVGIEELKDYFDVSYEQEILDAEAAEGENRADMKDTGYKMIDVLHSQVLPTIEPVALEQKFEMDVCGVPFIGYMDIVTANGVRDLKFAAKAPASNMADTSHQLTAYALAFRQMYGKQATELGLDYIVGLKTKTYYTPLPTTRTEKQLDRFAGTVAQVWADINSMIFYPNDGCWKCNDCPFRRTCKEATA